MTNIPVTGWYLENRIGSHNKFYCVLLSENGVVVTAWGGIGTKGQAKIQKFPRADDAEALGKRQLYSKKTGGYSPVTEDFKFSLDSDVLNEACQRQDPHALTRLFHDARLNPAYEGDAQAVLQHYDDVAKKARRLLETAGERTFEDVHTEFEELKKAWEVVRDKHDEVATAMSLTEQVLGQRLMSGSL